MNPPRALSRKDSPSSIGPIAVSIDTAAKMIGLGRTSFYKLMSSGKVEAIRCGGRVLVPVSQLLALIERSPTAAYDEGFGLRRRARSPKQRTR
jgi:excisionase family DNA binding protein